MTLRALSIHGVISLCVIVFWWFLGAPPQIFSILFGSFLAGIHLGLMIWCWSRILNKKSIALPGAIIVIKYAVLGAIAYKVLVEHWVDPLAFLVGLGLVVPSILIWGFLEMKTPTPNLEVSN